MPVHEKAVKNISRLHGYWIYQRVLSRSQYWSAEQRDQYVLGNLRRTLVRSWEGTPYYREQFRKAGFDPHTDLKTPQDVSQLPLLTKGSIRQSFGEMIDHRFKPGSVTSQTSGSTGEPLKMRLNESFLAFDSACVFRHRSWAGYTFGARMAALRSYVPAQETDPLWRHDRLSNTLYLSAYHLTPANCSEYVEQLLRFRPKFIRGYPSSICVLAEYAYPHREKFDFLRGVFTSSETLLPIERDRIQHTFGKRLFNWYGMTEPAVIITECEQHEGMHVNWEYGFAEFLPSDDLPPNEFRLVTTGFYNPVMPFIRYDTGDVVRLYDAPVTCRCGRNMPLVQSVVGRKDECIITGDGRRLPSVNFYSVFRKYNEILRFQLVQFGRAEVLAKLLLRPEAVGLTELLPRLREELKARLGPSVDLTVEVSSRLLTNSDGKTLTVVRKLGTRSIEEKDEYTIASQRAWSLEREGQTVFKLDWNEADRVPSAGVRQSLRELVENDHSVCWYPEANSEVLVQAVAEYAGIPPEHIVLTHGSDLAMELLSVAFIRPGDRILLLWPTYDHFRAMVEQRGAEVIRFPYQGDRPFPLEEFLQEVTKRCPRLVYVTSPNNPIGYALDRQTLEHLASACSRLATILIIDEAYFEFCGITGVDLAAKYPYCVVTRTFSKAFGMAGLRLGYIVASREIARLLKRLHNPKSVTMFAKAAALAALKDLKSVHSYVAEVLAGKEILYKLLDDYHVQYQRSLGNFITFEHQQAGEIVRFLAAGNILVRDRSGYVAGAGAVRLTVAGLESTHVLVPALREFFSKCGAEASSSCSQTRAAASVGESAV